ncbi:MAG: hypothetical protein FJW38_12290 [Acidobacteria bacterium]|nr:hypothetical protein [Acidobacteriota bacterium]
MSSHLEPLIDQVVGCLDDSSARRLAELVVPEALQARVDELAEKAAVKTITESETDEYETIVRFVTLVDLLRMKAGGRATYRAGN